MVSVICDEFHCLPDEAEEAINNDVNGRLFRILTLRNYNRAKQQYESGQKEEDVAKKPKGPLIELVKDIQWEINKEVFAAATKDKSE